MDEWLNIASTVFFVTLEFDSGDTINAMLKNEEEVKVLLNRYTGYTDVRITTRKFDNPTRI